MFLSKTILRNCSRFSVNPIMTRAFSVDTVATETDVIATQVENVIVEKVDGGVALVTLNRPKALNALCYALF
jgi:hypothetical protein